MIKFNLQRNYIYGIYDIQVIGKYMVIKNKIKHYFARGNLPQFHPYLFNSFMTEAVIIQKPVH